VEKNLVLLLPLATKQRTFSFSFSLKGELRSLETFFSPDIIFNSILRILVPTGFLKKKRITNHNNWEKERK
jgi:hypothetical protein